MRTVEINIYTLRELLAFAEAAKQQKQPRTMYIVSPEARAYEKAQRYVIDSEIEVFWNFTYLELVDDCRNKLSNGADSILTAAMIHDNEFKIELFETGIDRFRAKTDFTFQPSGLVHCGQTYLDRCRSNGTTPDEHVQQAVQSIQLFGTELESAIDRLESSEWSEENNEILQNLYRLRDSVLEDYIDLAVRTDSRFMNEDVQDSFDQFERDFSRIFSGVESLFTYFSVEEFRYLFSVVVLTEIQSALTDLCSSIHRTLDEFESEDYVLDLSDDLELHFTLNGERFVD